MSVPASPSDNFKPSVQDVANLLRARTKDQYGKELGQFTVDTRPTDEMVTEIIGLSASDITGTLGDDLPEEYWPELESLTALRAAMLVELTYFPEQVRSGRSAYAEYKTMYDDTLARLTEAIKSDEDYIDPGGIGTTANQTYLTFPDYLPIGGIRW